MRPLQTKCGLGARVLQEGGTPSKTFLVLQNFCCLFNLLPSSINSLACNVEDRMVTSRLRVLGFSFTILVDPDESWWWRGNENACVCFLWAFIFFTRILSLYSKRVFVLFLCCCFFPQDTLLLCVSCCKALKPFSGISLRWDFAGTRGKSKNWFFFSPRQGFFKPRRWD